MTNLQTKALFDNKLRERDDDFSQFSEYSCLRSNSLQFMVGFVLLKGNDGCAQDRKRDKVFDPRKLDGKI